MKRTYAALAAAVTIATGAAYADVQIYKQPNFAGAQLTLRGDTGNLAGLGFQDQASSLVINSGRWEFCSQPNFAGDCVTLGEGRYATLEGKLNHRIESARMVANTPVAENKVYDGDRNDRSTAVRGNRDARDNRLGDPARRNGSLELFTGPYFRGRSMDVERDIASLEGTPMDERGSSLVVHDGTWQVCTRPGFQGSCRVFEPGRYALLGPMEDRIASMRQIR